MAKIDWQYTDGTISKVVGVGTHTKDGDEYVVTFTYKVDGHYYGGECNAIAPFKLLEGGSIRVGYNPANPEENSLNRKRSPAGWYRLAVFAAILIYFLIRGCRK